jgi:hypothetical protein
LKKIAPTYEPPQFLVIGDEAWPEALHSDFAVIISALLDRQGGVVIAHSEA